MDIKGIIRNYSLIKAILAVRLKNRGREGMQTVCDMKITGTLSVFKY